MSQFIRTRSKAHGGITEREKALMDEHAKLWISRAMRTDPIEPDKIVPAIEGLYRVAGLKKSRVVIVPSPLVMAFAYGASAAIWYARKNPNKRATRAAARAATIFRGWIEDAIRAIEKFIRPLMRSSLTQQTFCPIPSTEENQSATPTVLRGAATRDATDDATDDATRAATDAATRVATRAATRAATYAATGAATRDATDDATDDATRAATGAATYAATGAATYAATYAATRDATDAATRDATGAATYAATGAATYAATRAATDDATDDATRTGSDAANACRELAGDFGIMCARRWYDNYQGGNMWAGYDCYLTACRDILGLELREHEGYVFWEQAAIHGGFRVMHEEFCLVSDFPQILLKDDQNRPHCETGPSHRWRDGWSLYHWHGTRIPAEWIEDRPSLTPQIALSQSNMELRRAACEILGWSNILATLKAKVIDHDDDPEIGDLVQVTLPDLPEPAKFLRVRCGTGREFAIGIPPHINKALDAQAWIVGLEPKDFVRPEVRA